MELSFDLNVSKSAQLSTVSTNPFFITGPTASGKSGIAVALAEATGGEIVNADAFQLYAGMDLLTAKPPPALLARAPHHLFGVLDAAESCDAQRYRTLARAAIREIEQRGRLAIVVGGSGLYIKALSHGLAELPRGSEELRARLARMALEDKVLWLLREDPEAHENVPLRNPRYVDRALEICLLTGQPQSKLRRTFSEAPPSGRGVVLEWPREILYERIEKRVDEMLAAGLLEEVSGLPEMNGTAAAAIGLREMRAHLAGGLTLAEAADAMRQATRRYAKRQITWFKRERWLQTVCLGPGATTESALAQIVTHFPCLNPQPDQPPPQ